MSKKFLSICLLMSAIAAGVQPVTAGDTTTAIFDSMFRTLTVTLDGNMMADPVLRLGDNSSQLVFSFDEISNDRSYLRCRILHCNSDWTPSRLVESEYVDGFNFAEIEDFGYSSGTFVKYVNYKFTIGQEGLTPLVSGNYLWQVYDENDPDTVLLQARFRVSEDSANISGMADGRTDRGFNDEYQQLSISVNTAEGSVPNPYADLFLEINQNSRPDTSRFLHHPLRSEGNNVIYQHDPALIFPAGNEYRRFETVRVNYCGMGIDSTSFYNNMHQAYIAQSESRADKNYYYDQTQRGRFKIDEYNASDPDLGADYIMTHFTLDAPEIINGDVYVEGELALRGYSDFNRMKYSPSDGKYHLDIPLKQGSYNYQYVVRGKYPASSHAVIGGNLSRSDNPASLLPSADASVIEGNKYETINEYNIYAWLRLPGARADRLIGSRTIICHQ